MPRANGIALLLVLALSLTARAEDAPEAAPTTPPKVKLAPHETAIYVVDMHCASCAKKIASRLYRVKGVMKVRTDVKADVAVITPQAKKQIDPKAAWSAVQAAGTQPTRLVGPQGTFVAHEKTKAPQKIAEAPAAERR